MRRSNFGSGSGGGRGGPLMTDHLQDLELELELLKRKRQLIQQQQNEMLYRSPVESRQIYGQHVQQFEERYNEPQRRSFPSSYEPPRGNLPFAPKRHAPWAAPDRFDAPSSSFKKPRQGSNPPSGYFNQSPNPPSHMGQPKPLMNLPPQNRRQPPMSHNSPKTKPGARAPQPSFKRRPRQVTQNRPSVAPSAAPPSVSAPQKPCYGTPREKFPAQENRQAVVLSDGVEPSRKANGRMELALGNIVKQIKASHSESEPLFMFPTLARLMKKGIRERVRTAMVGKVVGSVPEIVEEYRKMFPPATDADILELATVKTQKLTQKAELAIDLFEEGDPEQYFRKNMKRLLEVKLDELFQKSEQKYTGENAVPETEILDHLPDIKRSHETMEFNTRLDKVKQENNQGAKGENEEAKEKNEEAKVDEVKEKKEVAVLPKNEEYEKWISLLIGRILPRVLSRYKDYIIKILDMDKMYCETKAAILTHTNNSALVKAMNKNKKSLALSTEPSKDDPILPKNLPYFVKVNAVPQMPKRKQMQEFLHSFNSKTIKRHKKNSNLLFVGFANKEDYDKILLADKSQIGCSTINIVGTHNTRPSLFDNDKLKVGEKQNDDDNQNDSDILTPQLDDQIDDLLCSIRKADEEANVNNQSENEQNESDENKQGDVDIADNAQGDVENVDNNAKDDVEIVENPENGGAETEAEKGKDSDVEEVKVSENADVVMVEDDEVAPLKSDEVKEAVKGTPVKGRAPATPSAIRTRRASRLAQNN